MGYDMHIKKLKKKKEKDFLKNRSFIISEEYDDYGIKEIAWSDINILKDYFKNKNIEIKNDQIYFITETEYYEIIAFLENILKNTTLYDIIINKQKYPEHKIKILINIYSDLIKEKIDFSKESIFFQHDW